MKFLPITIALLLTIGLGLAAAPDGTGPWADEVIDSNQGLRDDGSSVAADRSDATNALGVAEGTNTINFFALGYGGELILKFDNGIIQGAGNDLEVVETTYGGDTCEQYTETVDVYGSEDGNDWTFLGGGCHETAVDIGAFTCIQYIKLIDTTDSNDFSVSYATDAYDVDGVQALNNYEGDCPVPSIQVTKSVQGMIEPYEVFPGEEITYEYEVTNDGNTPLTVTIEDDKCAPITGPTGDTGDDGFLGTDETWTYTCTMNILVDTTNTVTVVGTGPLGQTSEATDEATVAMKDLGCTLTQGYWKTHSSEGPAPEDPVWSDMEDDEFFTSGYTYYEIMWTAPKGGNKYISLAHQYIAATLNEENEAYMPANVQEAFDDATDLFNAYSAADFDKMKGKTATAVRKDFNDAAGVLASYNEGNEGVPHCVDLELVETLLVPANTDVPTVSAVLEADQAYRIRASGTAFAGDTIDFDAKYSITNKVLADTWTDLVTNYHGYGPTLLELFVDGSSVDWGLYNTEHVYWIDYFGTGAPASFHIYDVYYPNNVGDLTVEIYRVS